MTIIIISIQKNSIIVLLLVTWVTEPVLFLWLTSQAYTPEVIPFQATLTNDGCYTVKIVLTNRTCPEWVFHFGFQNLLYTHPCFMWEILPSQENINIFFQCCIRHFFKPEFYTFFFNTFTFKSHIKNWFVHKPTQNCCMLKFKLICNYILPT